MGKHINQVRRTIPDKSLAKRMKKLVIQWRSLAQQSPSTPNGVPIRTTPPPHAPTTPSPPLCTETTLTPATKQASLPTTQAQSNAPDQLTSVTPQPPSVSPVPPSVSSVPPSASSVPPSRPFSNPAMNRKKALHRLSTVKFATHKPPKSSLTSTPLSVPHTSPSPPPPVTSLAPALASQSVVSTSSPVVRTTVTEAPPLCSDAGAAPSSLQVRLPLHTVVKSFVVKIPLIHVTVPSNAPKLTQPIQPHRTTSPVHHEAVDGTLTVSGSSCNKPLTASGDPNANGISAPQPTTQACSSEATTHTLSPPPDIHSTSTQTKPPTLVVSIDRSLLLRQHLSGKLQDTTSTSLPPDPAQDASLSSVQNDSSKSCSDSRESSPHFPPSVQHKCAFSDRGYLDLNGLWRKWTDPIIHEDSFAVNVLPYVYVDGWDEELEAGVP